MTNLLSQLTKDAQARFLEELNYLNLGEIRGFCSDRGIPYRILAQYPNGKVKTTKDGSADACKDRPGSRPKPVKRIF